MSELEICQTLSAAGLLFINRYSHLQKQQKPSHTDEQQNKLFTRPFAQSIKQTENDLRDMGYDPSKIIREIALLRDYTYNVGTIKKFPNFTKAIVIKTMKKLKKNMKENL